MYKLGLFILACGLACGAAGVAILADLRSTGAAAPLSAEAENYEVDAVHSALIFRIRYAGISTFFGRFNEFSGSFSVDEADLSKSSFDLKVQTGSVDSGNTRRDAHLASPDFFSAKEHPEISFKSQSVKVVDGKELAVAGELTLRGVTKPVTAKVIYGGAAKGGRGGPRAGFDGQLTIKREDFGITFGEGMLGSDVTIEMGLNGVKK